MSAHGSGNDSFIPLVKLLLKNKAGQSASTASFGRILPYRDSHIIPYHGCPPLADDEPKLPQHSFVVFFQGALNAHWSISTIKASIITHRNAGSNHRYASAGFSRIYGTRCLLHNLMILIVASRARLPWSMRLSYAKDRGFGIPRGCSRERIATPLLDTANENDEHGVASIIL